MTGHVHSDYVRINPSDSKRHKHFIDIALGVRADDKGSDGWPPSVVRSIQRALRRAGADNEEIVYSVFSPSQGEVGFLGQWDSNGKPFRGQRLLDKLQGLSGAATNSIILALCELHERQWPCDGNTRGLVPLSCKEAVWTLPNDAIKWEFGMVPGSFSERATGYIWRENTNGEPVQAISFAVHQVESISKANGMRHYVVR